MHVFCALTELALLHQSEFIVCDGTFEMAPDCAYQLYTLRGFLHGEAVPLAWALLPNKTTATYVELFNCLHNAMVTATIRFWLITSKLRLRHFVMFFRSHA